MTKNIYLKAPPGYTLKKTHSTFHRLKTALSLFLIGLGITALTTVIYPLLSYQFFYSPGLRQTSSISPISPQELSIQKAQAQEPEFLPEMINTSLDYTNAKNWFPQAQNQLLTSSSTPSSSRLYTLSIPKLNIKKAVVKVGAQDLKSSLSHYEGTAMPGDLGNAVIFGHSVLPQFFNPKNYTTIFSTLHTLKEGDKIVIDHDGVEYTYIIRDLYEVKPNNLTPLAQSYGNSQLTLITCTPPGTYLRRLIVKATLS